MTSALIVTASVEARLQLQDTLLAAGAAVQLADNGESGSALLAQFGPELVLLDTELAVPAAFVTDARRSGATVIYFSSRLNVYDLAMYARQRGLRHLSLQISAIDVRVLIDQALVIREMMGGGTTLRADFAEVIISSSDVIARSRELTAKSQETRAQTRDLKAARAIMLAACRHSVAILHQSVVEATRELRDDGVPLAHILELVTAGIQHSVDLGARDVPSVEEATEWAVAGFLAA